MSTRLTLGAAAALAGLAALSRATGSRSSGETRAQLEERLRAQHGVTLHLSGPRWGDAHEPHIVTLDSIVVPASLRDRGTGSAVMRELTAWADAAGHILSLTPAGDFGGSVPRLRRFYKRFGFVRNLGKHKDFRTRDAMIRYPRSGARNVVPDEGEGRQSSPALRAVTREMDQILGGPGLPPVALELEDSDSSITLRWRQGKELVAYFRVSVFGGAEWQVSMMPPDCRQAWEDLGRPALWVVRGSELYDTKLRGRGLGRSIYRDLLRQVSSRGGWLAPGRCSGSVTSADAQRVWRSLRRHHEGRGPLLTDRGARNEDTPWAPTQHLSVAVRHIGPRETIERVLASKAPVYVIEAPDGQRAEVRGWDLDNHGSVFEGLWRGLSGERLQRELMAFARWLEATPWPMTLWRGTRGLEPPPPPGPVGQQAGPHQGYHWTVSRPIAWRFATGLHTAARNSGYLSPDIHGRIYRAVLDDLGAVNWPQTVYLFYRYTHRKAGDWAQGDVEEQILVKHHDRLRDVVIQQVEPVPEQLIPR